MFSRSVVRLGRGSRVCSQKSGFRRLFSTGVVNDEKPLQRTGGLAFQDIFESSLSLPTSTIRPRGLMNITPISRIVDTDRTVKVTAKGKEPSMRALVVSGNGMGSGGYGIGKGKNMPEAIMDAKRKSLDVSKWISVKLTPDGRLYMDTQGTFKGTKVLLRSVKETKQGLSCNRIIYGICEVFGIKHITAKRITRKRSPYSLVNAVFLAIDKQVHPDDAAMLRGGKADRSNVDFNYAKKRNLFQSSNTITSKL